MDIQNIEKRYCKNWYVAQVAIQDVEKAAYDALTCPAYAELQGNMNTIKEACYQLYLDCKRLKAVAILVDSE